MWTREDDIELANFIGWDNCTESRTAEQRLKVWAAEMGGLFRSKEARLMLVKEGWIRSKNESADLYKILIDSPAFVSETMRGRWRLIDSPAPRFNTLEGSRLIMKAVSVNGFRMIISLYASYTIFIETMLGDEVFEQGDDMETPLAIAVLKMFRSVDR